MRPGHERRDVGGMTTTATPCQPPRVSRSRWAAIGAAVAVTFGGGAGIHLAGAATSDPSSLVSITPTRILDTRDPVDLGLAGPFVSAVGQDLQVTGPVPTPGGTQTVVPDGATGVLLNVTVVQPTAAGFVSVRPAGTPGPPETSSLNFEAGDIVPNAVFVALPTDGPDAGRIEVTYDAFGTPGPTTDILGDVVGYTMGNPDVYTKAEADAKFLTDVDAYTKAEADALFLAQATTPVQRLYFARVDEQGDVRSPTPPGITAEETVLGAYEVDFGQNLDFCSYQATLGLWGTPFVGSPSTTGFVAVTRVSGSPSKIGVRTRDANGDPAQRPFHLQVTCPLLTKALAP